MNGEARPTDEDETHEDETAPSRPRLIGYWRACLADKGLGQGRFEQRDLPPDNKQLVELSAAELSCGRVERRTARALFRNVDKNLEHVQVCLWPLLARRRTSHGAGREDGFPDHVAPIVSVALVARKDGAIRPRRTVIARDLLEPLPEGAFSIGTVEGLDKFLTESPFASAIQDGPHDEMWQQYREDCRRLLQTVVAGWPGPDSGYERTGGGLMEVAGDAAATVRNILALYDTVLKTKPAAPLLESYAAATRAPASPGLAAPHDLAGRLGHSTDGFPLADKQRDVLAHLAAAGDGEILAVNGPPGTGKTTMLLSAIAGEWVRAARAGGDPPVIAAASTNNQAVTNIIDAFKENFARGEGPFAGRWLTDIDSFGLYLPAWSRAVRGAETYQTEAFFAALETEEYFEGAKPAYLEAATAALPDLESVDVETVVEALRDRIDAAVRRLEAADAARRRLDAARAAMERALGVEPDAALAWLECDRDRCAREDMANRDLLAGWKSYLAAESLFLSLFSFLPAVGRTRRLRAGRFLEEAGYAEDVGARLRIDAVEPELRHRANESRQRLQTADGERNRGRAAMNELADACKGFAGAAEAIGAGALDPDDHAALERAADCGIRFQLFLLATHYWEGRWLLEMGRLLPGIEKERRRTGRRSVMPRWRRRMMLTPCMVSTFATLPAKMKASRFEDGGFHDDYLFNFIDLLIVDEAGQTVPEVAGASFSLAKKALVIGDTRQIEPISGIPKIVDIGNLIEAGLLPADATQEDLDRVEDVGVTSTAGSAMRVAQAACRYHAEPELDRGLYLFEHRRCYDEIVEYCNALCYRGKLDPRRGPAPGAAFDGDGPIPGPLAYLHVDGLCSASGGSRRNAVEAQTIAVWLARHREPLEAAYGKRLEEIVGVVTPFGRQMREIAAACRDQKIAVHGRNAMTIGTIHALQGADRDVVIFSPAYSKHADGGFIDMSTSMLNVAVSRAKDAFIVMGDMDLFSTARPGSPRRLLGEFLFARPENAISFEVQRRGDLVQPGQDVRMLRDAGEHDEFLLDLLGGAGAGKISIVSPWIVASTIQRTGLLPALAAARERGTEIVVYVDPELSSRAAHGGPANLERARAALEEAGISMKKVRQLHSKIVVAGEGLLSVGSFNWLSANRDGKYARHETSLVYRGAHLSDEIDAIIGSLQKRLDTTHG